MPVKHWGLWIKSWINVKADLGRTKAAGPFSIGFRIRITCWRIQNFRKMSFNAIWGSQNTINRALFTWRGTKLIKLCRESNGPRPVSQQQPSQSELIKYGPDRRKCDELAQEFHQEIFIFFLERWKPYAEVWSIWGATILVEWWETLHSKL